MFTGIVEELGEIKKAIAISGGYRFQISANLVLEDIKIDDSIAINGICLTVIDFNGSSFSVEAVGDTIDKTTLETMRKGKIVNLERALTLKSRLGGHLVQGHVNCLGSISQLTRKGKGWVLKIRIPTDHTKYIVNEGSIALDGISFTVAKIEKDIISINLIPHTYEQTNIATLKTGDRVNVEVDIIGKYIESLFKNDNNAEGTVSQWLNNLGWE